MRITTLSVFWLAVLSSTAANAALEARGPTMIYDSVLNITWLQDANMAGSMTWDDSVAWAAGLSHGGYDDWRLPSMDANMDNSVVDCEFASEMGCRDNELGYMYYQNMVTFFDPGLFTNVQFFHWSGTEFAPNPGLAWAYDFGSGFQGGTSPIYDFGAWAVRLGDVAVVPLPAGLWLLMSGLIGLAGLRKKA